MKRQSVICDISTILFNQEALPFSINRFRLIVNHLDHPAGMSDLAR